MFPFFLHLSHTLLSHFSLMSLVTRSLPSFLVYLLLFLYPSLSSSLSSLSFFCFSFITSLYLSISLSHLFYSSFPFAHLSSFLISSHSPHSPSLSLSISAFISLSLTAPPCFLISFSHHPFPHLPLSPYLFPRRPQLVLSLCNSNLLHISASSNHSSLSSSSALPNKPPSAAQSLMQSQSNAADAL